METPPKRRVFFVGFQGQEIWIARRFLEFCELENLTRKRLLFSGSFFFTIVQAKHDIVRVIWKKTPAKPCIGQDNTMFCACNSREKVCWKNSFSLMRFLNRQSSRNHLAIQIRRPWNPLIKLYKKYRSFRKIPFFWVRFP